MSIMEIKQVGYSYDNKKKVLKGVNAEMEQGKLYALSLIHISTGWTNLGTGTAAAAALGCISPRPFWSTMGYSTAW